VNLHHIRYFIKLAQLEHYTKAAEALMITQPTLSQAIASLEEQLGVRLFEKEGRNIVLTKYGKVFLEYMQSAIEVFDNGVKVLQKTGVGEGRIDLGFLQTLGLDLVPELTQAFLAKHPEKDIKFRFYTGVTTEIIQALKDKKYDIGLCSKLEKEPELEFFPIARQELVVIVPKNHPLAEKDTIDLRETIPYPQIAFSKSSGLRPIVDGLFEKIGASYKIAYEVEVDQVIAGLVAKNFGIAVIPNMPILNYIDVKPLTITYPSFERMFYLAVLKNKYLAPVVKEFKDFVIEHAKI